jgi:Fe-S cluster assembly iron-binding protein IscA
MALDELRENDESFENSGISYVIEKNLLEKVQPVKVDYVSSAFGSGFKIDSSLVPAGGCGSSCSC